MAKRMKKKKTAKGAFLIDKAQFDKLTDKLDKLIKITAASVFRGKKLREGIIFLTDFGFSAKDVAEVLDTTEKYVWNVNSETKKQKKKTEKMETEKTPEQGTQTATAQ